LPKEDSAYKSREKITWHAALTCHLQTSTSYVTALVRCQEQTGISNF